MVEYVNVFIIFHNISCFIIIIACAKGTALAKRTAKTETPFTLIKTEILAERYIRQEQLF